MRTTTFSSPLRDLETGVCAVNLYHQWFVQHKLLDVRVFVSNQTVYARLGDASGASTFSDFPSAAPSISTLHFKARLLGREDHKGQACPKTTWSHGPTADWITIIGAAPSDRPQVWSKEEASLETSGARSPSAVVEKTNVWSIVGCGCSVVVEGGSWTAPIGFGVAFRDVVKGTGT
jgi:hypothetical protein